MTAIDIVGWLGAAALLVAYGLLASRLVEARRPTYSILNTVGAAALAANGVAHSAWPSVTLNAIWFVIGVASAICAVSESGRRRGAAETTGDDAFL